MSKSVFALGAPFSISQAADAVKTRFDAQGWGTGLVGIQGGYRVTSSMAADSLSAPIVLKADNSVVVPVSWTNLTACEWVDNFQGKNLVYPNTDPQTRWRLLAYLPGVRRMRIKFTPIRRVDALTTGLFSDIEIWYVEQRFDNSPADMTYNEQVSDLMGALSGSYTVGTSYTTRWSHQDTGTLAGEVQLTPTILLRTNNVIIKLEIEYDATENVFGAQDSTQIGATYEFRFANYSSLAFGVCTPLPIKFPWKPRILLAPPESHPYMTNTANVVSAQMHTGWGSLFNAFRDDNLSEVGIWQSNVLAFAAMKAFGFGTTLNILLASNADKKGFMLEMAQSGKTVGRVVTDRLDKASALPATPVVVPERQLPIQSHVPFAISNTSLIFSESHNLHLFRVKGTGRKLKSLTISGIYNTNTRADTIKIYAVSVSNVGSANGLTLTYNGLHTSINTVGDGTSTGNLGSIKATGLDLAFPDGYYALVIPNSIQLVRQYTIFPRHTNVAGEVRYLGGIEKENAYDSSTWVAGTTVLNKNGGNFSSISTVLNNHQDTLSLFMTFENLPTPSQQLGQYAEGTVLLGYHPLEGRFTDRFQNLADNSAGYSRAMPGLVVPFGIDPALNTIEPASPWFMSPLPNWYTGTRTGDTSNGQNYDQPKLEFDAYTEPWDVWCERYYRAAFKTNTLKIRTGTATAEGNAIVNPDTSEDIVVQLCNYGNRSITFRST
jgi:hypothetical protein